MSELRRGTGLGDRLRADYVTCLRLENFRRFSSTEVSFARRFTLLIGKNACGKTSVLDALSITLGHFIPYHTGVRLFPFGVADVLSQRFGTGRSFHFETQFPGIIRLSAVFDGLPMDCSVKRTERRSSLAASQGLAAYQEQLTGSVRGGADLTLPVVAYYSPNRLRAVSAKRAQLRKAGSRLDGYVRATEAELDFNSLLSWWKTEEYDAVRYQTESIPLEAVRLALQGCIPGLLGNGTHYDFKLEELIVNIDGRPEPFSQSSTGFRHFIAMVCDIARRASLLNPSLPTQEVLLRTPGIVIIDEIDAHLHPEWQRRAVYDLIKTFPNMQFIATTHSPFIIQGVPPSAGETMIVRLDDMNRIEPQEMSIEVAAEYVQGVQNVERSYVFEEQSAKIIEALSPALESPGESAKRLDLLLEAEPFSPLTKALMELKGIALRQPESDAE